MKLIGFKGCPNCGKKLIFLDSMVQSFNNKYRTCASCDKSFKFEGIRNKLAWMILLLVIVLPSILVLQIPEIFLNTPLLTHYPIKYFLAAIIFYLVSGYSKYLPNKVKNENASEAGTDAQKDARPF